MPDTLEPAGAGRYPPDMEKRVIILEQIAQTTAVTLERLERRFETIDRRFETIDRRFEVIDRRIDALTS
jgi:chaperonin cofactor prefoldin